MNFGRKYQQPWLATFQRSAFRRIEGFRLRFVCDRIACRETKTLWIKMQMYSFFRSDHKSTTCENSRKVRLDGNYRRTLATGQVSSWFWFQVRLERLNPIMWTLLYPITETLSNRTASLVEVKVLRVHRESTEFRCNSRRTTKRNRGTNHAVTFYIPRFALFTLCAETVLSLK